MRRKYTLYTTETCSKCLLLKNLLKQRGVLYNLVDDVDIVMEKAQSLGVQELPIFVVEATGDTEESNYTGTGALVFAKGI